MSRVSEPRPLVRCNDRRAARARRGGVALRAVPVRLRGAGPRAAAALLAVLLSCLAGSALAASLDGAKAAGLVGERPDGYLGLVAADAPVDVKALVSDVNARRRAEYAKIAKANGTSVDAVAALAGAKLVERAGAGEFVMTSAGRWVRK